MQCLKKSWLVIWKMTQGIWLIFMRAVKSLKVSTLTLSWRRPLSYRNHWFAEQINGFYMTTASVMKGLISSLCQKHIRSHLKGYKRDISHDTEERSKLWRKTDVFVWKIAWRTWWILTRAVGSLKICTLIGYFCRKYVMCEPKNAKDLCRKKWLMVSKITQGIRWIFTQVVESNIR